MKTVSAMALAVLVGCAGGDATLGDSAAGEVDSSVRGAFVVGLSEWKVDIPMDTLPAGRHTFRVENTGTRAHALEIEGGGNEWETGDIAPGGKSELTVDLEPGTYELYCPIENQSADHEARGMKRMLVIRPA